VGGVYILIHRRRVHRIRVRLLACHDQRLAVPAEWGPLEAAGRWRAVLPEPLAAEAARDTPGADQFAA
jgi:hypothetical protein